MSRRGSSTRSSGRTAPPPQLSCSWSSARPRSDGWFGLPHNALPTNSRWHWVDIYFDRRENWYYTLVKYPHMLFYDNPYILQGLNAALNVSLMYAVGRAGISFQSAHLGAARPEPPRIVARPDVREYRRGRAAQPRGTTARACCSISAVRRRGSVWRYSSWCSVDHNSSECGARSSSPNFWSASAGKGPAGSDPSSPTASSW